RRCPPRSSGFGAATRFRDVTRGDARVTGLTTGLFSSSAFYGGVQISDCKQLRVEHGDADWEPPPRAGAPEAPPPVPRAPQQTDDEQAVIGRGLDTFQGSEPVTRAAARASQRRR